MTGAHVMATVVGTEPTPHAYSAAAYMPQIPVEQIAYECATHCRELGYRYMGLQVSQPTHWPHNCATEIHFHHTNPWCRLWSDIYITGNGQKLGHLTTTIVFAVDLRMFL